MKTRKSRNTPVAHAATGPHALSAMEIRIAMPTRRAMSREVIRRMMKEVLAALSNLSTTGYSI